jgi:hypothetical protein
MQKGLQIYKKHERVNDGVFFICRIENVDATSMDAILWSRIIKLSAASSDGSRTTVISLATWNITWSGVAAHGDVPVDVVLREGRKCVANAMYRNCVTFDRIGKVIDLESTTRAN